MEILTVENLTFTYPLCDRAVLSDISFSVSSGELALLCGSTGSGKSTLLRLLKRELAPKGDLSGRILYKNTPADDLSPVTAAREIGYVAQNPEQQLVTDKVWHELAFGLENLNLPQNVISQKIAETASYFGIDGWFDKSVSELSGGQKQLLNLAAVMVMNPSLLILDEPTAQLDPIAASDFIATLKKLNSDFSLTIIVAEHRLEELLPVCDRLLVLENGRLAKNGSPREIAASLDENSTVMPAMPTPVRLYHMLDGDGDCPLTVREGREYLTSKYKNHIRSLPEEIPDTKKASPALEFRNVYFKYSREMPDVLRDLSFTVYENEVFCILGGNGSGKTTSLSAASGILKPYSGTIRIFGKKIRDHKNQALYKNCLSFLPQDVQTVFLKNTVREELADAGITEEEIPSELVPLSDKHPYDCSGGEQQLIALAKALATRPRLLLADEPTKGLDAAKKEKLCGIFKSLAKSGTTVVTVTHDTEFAASCADRCALFFRGGIVSCAPPAEFFSENSFYTTAACRIGRGFYDRAVTVDRLVGLCRLNERCTEENYADDKK